MEPTSRLAMFGSAALGALSVAGAVTALALTGAIDLDDDSTSEQDPTEAAAPAAASRSSAQDVVALYERARRGVVEVRTGQATGSGFVVDRKGTILTNQHVVGDDRRTSVRFEGQSRRVTARVAGTDPSTDVAVLRVDPDDVRGGLTVLPLGSSERLRVGELAVALGSPFGLDGTVTTGIVSGVDRDIQAPNGFTIRRAVQTDAAINPGNSGGPLLDARGRVVGINAQGRSGGVGFAIPIDTVKDVMPRIARGERIERPYLGVSTRERVRGDGVQIGSVASGGPAERAGLRSGDVVTRIDTQQIREPSQVAAAIESRRPGDTVRITFIRDGDNQIESVRLGTRPEEASIR